jgi:hypothetical protein
VHLKELTPLPGFAHWTQQVKNFSYLVLGRKPPELDSSDGEASSNLQSYSNKGSLVGGSVPKAKEMWFLLTT